MQDSFARALVAKATLAAVLLCVASQQESARGQIPPPTICNANLTKAAVGAPTRTWVAGPPPGWKYRWIWTVYYSCPNGNFTNCDADTAVQYNVYDSAGNPGTSFWEYLCHMNYKSCNTSWQKTHTTTWPTMGGIAPGTIFEIAFYAASHDATIQNCSDQDYQLIAAFLYQAPPAP